MTAAFWVYQCSVATSMVLILSAPYNALIIAHEQMKAFAYISIFEAVSRLSIAYLIQWTTWDKLIVYAALLLFLQLIVRLCYSMYCRRNFPESRAPLRYEKHRLKEMFAYSGWTSFGDCRLYAGSEYFVEYFFRTGGQCRSRGIGTSTKCSNPICNELSDGVESPDYEILCC